MRQSNIEKYNLQSLVLPTYHKCNRNKSEAARELTRLSGVKITDMCLSRYFKSIKKSISKDIPHAKDSKEAVAKLAAEDRDGVVNSYTKLLEAQIDEIWKIIKDQNKKPEAKIYLINQAIGPKGGMNRILNEVGFGKESPIQINNQMNVILKETLDKLVIVLVEECNGSSDRIIARLKSSIDVHN